MAAPMELTSPLRVVEFYSGVGGMHFALSLSRVPAEVVAAVDINDIANKIYRFNFPEINLLQRNIQSVTLKEFTKLDADMFLMSPPCQPFTRVGLKGDRADPRTASFLYLLDTLPKLTKKPGYILVENVKGFESSETRRQLVDVLQKCNYKFKEFLLSPTHVGIPNQRLRYFLLAKLHPLQFGDTFLIDGTHSLLTHEIPFDSRHGNQNSPDPEGSHIGKHDLVKASVEGENLGGRKGMTKNDSNQFQPSHGSICRTVGQQDAGVGPASSRDCARSVRCSEQAEEGQKNMDRPARRGQGRELEGGGMSHNCIQSEELGSSSGQSMPGHKMQHNQISEKESELSNCADRPISINGNMELPYGSDQSGKKDACGPFGLSWAPTETTSQSGHEQSTVQQSEVLNSLVRPSGISRDDNMENGLRRSADGDPVVHLRNIKEFLETLSEAETEEYLVPDKLLLRFGRVMDIVQGEDGDKTCCFTKAYCHYVEGTGSFLQNNKAVSLHWAFEKGLDDAKSLYRLRQLRLRYFTPREVANFHCFPREFGFPADVSRKQRYRVLGNSLNAYVVSLLLNFLTE